MPIPPSGLIKKPKEKRIVVKAVMNMSFLIFLEKIKTTRLIKLTKVINIEAAV
jgi:hypothetical protein